MKRLLTAILLLGLFSTLGAKGPQILNEDTYLAARDFVLDEIGSEIEKLKNPSTGCLLFDAFFMMDEILESLTDTSAPEFLPPISSDYILPAARKGCKSARVSFADFSETHAVYGREGITYKDEAKGYSRFRAGLEKYYTSGIEPDSATLERAARLAFDLGLPLFEEHPFVVEVDSARNLTRNRKQITPDYIKIYFSMKGHAPLYIITCPGVPASKLFEVAELIQGEEKVNISSLLSRPLMVKFCVDTADFRTITYRDFKNKVNKVNLEILESGKIFLNNERTSFQEAGQMIGTLFPRSEPIHAVVAADREVAFSQVERAARLLCDNGAKEVMIVPWDVYCTESVIRINPNAAISTKELLEQATIELRKSVPTGDSPFESIAGQDGAQIQSKPPEDTTEHEDKPGSFQGGDVIRINPDASISTKDILNEAAATLREKAIVVEMAKDSSLKLNGESCTLEELRKTLPNMYNNSLTVHLVADPELPSYKPMDVIQRINESGFSFTDISDSFTETIMTGTAGVRLIGTDTVTGYLRIAFDISDSIEIEPSVLASIELKETGEIKLNREKVDIEELPALVTHLFAVKAEDNMAVIRIDGDVKWGEVLKAARIAKDAGAEWLILLRGKPSVEE